ncbi:MAG: hypothetical protein V4532_17505 [Pseudomonadota bacterium]
MEISPHAQRQDRVKDGIAHACDLAGPKFEFNFSVGEPGIGWGDGCGCGCAELFSSRRCLSKEHFAVDWDAHLNHGVIGSFNGDLIDARLLRTRHFGFGSGARFLCLRQFDGCDQAAGLAVGSVPKHRLRQSQRDQGTSERQ